MQIHLNTVSAGRGVWGERLYEYQEVDRSLASDRDAALGDSRITYFLLFREPGAKAWDGRSFEHPEARCDFLATWFVNRETAHHVDPPMPDEMYLPLRMMEQRVTSIVFILNYIQVVTNSFILSVYANPEIFSGGRMLRPGDSEYCGALVALIGEVIDSLEEQAGEFIELRFVNGARLIVPWEPELDEIAVLFVEHDMYVWP